MSLFTFSLTGRSDPINVEDYRLLAQRKLPEVAWQYLENGADDEISLRANRNVFEKWNLRQKMLAGIREPVLTTAVAGTNISLPVVLAPTGLGGLMHWTGEISSSRGAEAAGTRKILSTASSYTLEEVADATEENHWFQLYPFGDKQKVAGLMSRAKAAGYTALFLTVDVPVRGNREGERRSGMDVPMQLTPGRCIDIAFHPVWLYNVFRHRRVVPVQIMPPKSAGKQRRSIADLVLAANEQARVMQSDLDWEDLRWIRDQWQGKLYVKGVMDGDDAVRAVDEFGVDGLVISNHGARQLDCVNSTLDALCEVAGRVGCRTELILDGGVRRGTDVIKALCLGAKAVLIGRPYLYGLAAAGERGVKHIIDIFRDEMRRNMVLMGCPDVALLDSDWVIPVSGRMEAPVRQEVTQRARRVS